MQNSSLNEQIRNDIKKYGNAPAMRNASLGAPIIEQAISVFNYRVIGQHSEKIQLEIDY
jgi:hypothetical protein